MKLYPEERAAERIALILLDFNETAAEVILADAADLAARANQARIDPYWWTVAGRPRLNKRLAQIKRKLEMRRKK